MSQKKGHENDLKGLRLVHDHRWLRPEELGIFMWPKQKASLKSAEKIIRKWKAKKPKWIIDRPLPDGAGTAIVLSERGAAQIGAPTGKDWGDHELDEETGVSEWKPPRKWKHELYQSSLLACLTRLGYKVITERAIRSLTSRKKRIPDGIVTSPEFRCWLEVESARKTGPLHRTMVRTLISVATQPETKVFLDTTVNGAMLAFSSTQRDERTHRLAHLSRTVNAIRKEALRDIPLMLAIMEVDDAGAVIDVTLGRCVVKFDAAARVLDQVQWSRDDDGIWHGTWKRGIEFKYWPDGDANLPWAWEASISTGGKGGERDRIRDLGSGHARTAEDAQRAAYSAAMRNLTSRELGE
jgi:hypothetical protein